MEKFQLDLKFKSITARWFINIFALVVVIVTIAAISASVLFYSIHTERVEVLAHDYSNEFNSLTGCTPANFEDTAITLAGQFIYKNQLEIQVIDKEDNIVVSTSGFQAPSVSMPDYDAAKQSGTTQAMKSESDSGETILAATVPIYNSSGEFLGCYRWITSLKAVNKLTMGFVIMCIVIAVAVLLIFGFSGFYFIKSIVKPIKDVSNIARKIAMGDFNSRIEFSKNDEIGELCDTINYMANELESAKNLKNDFISSVSHELRTPLTAIRGWGETAKMSIETDLDLVNRGLDVVLSEADRLSGLVEELLDFSRIESGRLSVMSQPLNVTKILGEAADMYAELSKKNGIDFVFNTPGEELTVLGDTNRLKQVFINIIDNAVKYTESGGQVLISQTKEEGCVRIFVTDTGVGIPAADIDRVKEKFYKANKTVRGSGIGLAVADEIIRQLGGLIFIESTEGAGTTVTIVLPLYIPEEEPTVPISMLTEVAAEEVQPEQTNEENDINEDLPEGENKETETENDPVADWEETEKIINEVDDRISETLDLTDTAKTPNITGEGPDENTQKE